MKLAITPLNTDHVENGTWAMYRGVNLLVARNNNTKFKEAFRRLSRPYQDDMDNNRLDEKTQEMILCRSMAEGILVGWDETTFIVDNEPVPYSTENAEELLKNDPDCREFVLNYSNDINNFLQDSNQRTVGKSTTA